MTEYPEPMAAGAGGFDGGRRTAVGAPSPAFDELFAYIDGLDQWELRKLTERLLRRVPPWAYRNARGERIDEGSR